MKKQTLVHNYLAVLFAIAFCGLAALLVRTLLMSDVDAVIAAPSLTPWQSVGGCGAGGSGGGGAGGPKWIGTDVSGGLVDVEVMYTATIGQTNREKNVSTRLSVKPHYLWTLGLSLPFNSKIGQVQYQTNQDPAYHITGGLGDISLDLSRPFGAEGQVTLSLALTLPTGQYDIKRGSDNASFYLPAGLQNGGGIWAATLGLAHSRIVGDGMLLFDMSYSNPFAMRLFSAKNEFVDEFYTAYRDSTSNRRFHYRFKPYGENDLGSYAPPGISGSVFYGYRGVPGYIHSWGVSVSFPLGQTWMNNEVPSVYDPKPDPDHANWSGAFNYGVELSRSKLPIFISIIKPIHEKGDEDVPGWKGPDWRDFLHSWSAAIGVKTTMF